MSTEVKRLFDQFVNGRNIKGDTLSEIIKSAIISASKKRYGEEEDVRVNFDPENGKLEAFFKRKVVKKVKNPDKEIALAEAERLQKDAAPGDLIEVRIPAEEFGRLATQAARQVLLQKIREEERENIFNEYTDKKGQIATGTVLRSDGHRVIVQVGDIEALMPQEEQARTEVYNANDRMKFFIVNVKKTPRGPRVIVSRTHPGLIKALFQLEVPEIADGTVEVKGIAREPGERTKIAVHSLDPNVDPVGACVGMRGSRVQAIVREVNGEKIDIVHWSADMETFVRNAMSPAKLDRVIFNPEEKQVLVIAPDDQLALAIGRKGQNAKLAARLVGWRIDIKNHADFMKEQREKAELAFKKRPDVPLSAIEGLDAGLAEKLAAAGFADARALSQAEIPALAGVEGLAEGAEDLKEKARVLVEAADKEAEEAAAAEKAAAEAAAAEQAAAEAPSPSPLPEGEGESQGEPGTGNGEQGTDSGVSA